MANSISVFQAKKAADLSNPTSASVFVQSDSSSKAAAAYLRPIMSGAVKSVGIRVVARGRATGGTTTNWTPKIQWGSSTTAGSNTDVAAATARAFNSTNGSWEIVFDGFWDSTSQKLSGRFSAQNGSAATLDSVAAITQVSSVDLTANGNAFCVAGLFSASNSSNSASLDELIVEVR